MATRISVANLHALDVLGDLQDGAYLVVICDEELSPAPFVAPPRGIAFNLDGKWMVFSPMENAN